MHDGKVYRRRGATEGGRGARGGGGTGELLGADYIVFYVYV